MKRFVTVAVAAGGLGLIAGACGDDQSQSNPGMDDTQPPVPMGTNPAVQEEMEGGEGGE